MTRGIADLPSTHCVATTIESITPDLSNCCVGDSELDWKWYENEDDDAHKLRAKFRIRTNWLGTTKYITRGRYKKGWWRRKADFNPKNEGYKYTTTPAIECAIYTSHLHNSGESQGKRWYRDVGKDPFIPYRHFENSIDFELVAKKGGKTTTAEEQLPKD